MSLNNRLLGDADEREDGNYLRVAVSNENSDSWASPESLNSDLNPLSPSARGLKEPDIDSYDYPNHNSLVQRIDFRRRTNAYFKRRALLRWVLTAIVGMLTAFVALGIWTYSRKFSDWKFDTVASYTKDDAFFVPFLIYISFSCVYVFIAVCLVAFIEPVAVGSGIPQIKCILNGLKIPRVVRMKTLFVKAVGVAFAVSGGLPIGIEGPMIHSGAICGAAVSQGKSTACGINTSFTKFREFRNDKEKRDFVSAGAAAGVSCAFGAPIGGVLFSLEEGSSWWSQKLTWRTFFCSMFAYLVLAMFTSGLREHGKWGHLSDKSMFTFGDFSSVNQTFTYAASELPFFILMGAFGGVAGAIYNYANTRITKFRQAYVASSAPKIMEGVLTALVISATTFVIPYFFRGMCLDTTGNEAVEDQLVQFYCPDGQWNPAASLFMSPMDDTIKMLFHSNHHFSFVQLFLVFFVIFWTSCWCYGLSVPSGLFVPTLLAGAGFGRIIGQLVADFVPFETVAPGTYALIGAAAVLGGMARMTISLTVILIEATGDIQYGLPIMASLMTAKWIGDFFNHGLYEIHVQLNGWQFLEYDPPPIAYYLLAADIMHKHPQCIEEVVRAGEVLDLLHRSKHQGFPVIQKSSSGQTVLRGLVLRKHLIGLLKGRAFTAEKPVPFQNDPMMTEEELEKDYPHYPGVDTIQLSVSERDMFLDLAPYLSPSPHVVNTTAPVTVVFHLFRTMGLRHVPVVTKSNEVVGIITRKDLTNLRFRKQLGEIIEGNSGPPRFDDITRYSFVHHYLESGGGH